MNAEKQQWWRETRSRVCHLVVHVCGTTGQLAEAACGRYVGPAFGDVQPGQGPRKYCPTCKRKATVNG